MLSTTFEQIPLHFHFLSIFISTKKWRSATSVQTGNFSHTTANQSPRLIYFKQTSKFVLARRDLKALNAFIFFGAFRPYFFITIITCLPIFTVKKECYVFTLIFCAFTPWNEYERSVMLHKTFKTMRQIIKRMRDITPLASTTHETSTMKWASVRMCDRRTKINDSCARRLRKPPDTIAFCAAVAG